MSQRHSDFALLGEFVRDGRQPAFATLVRQHLNLVYGTALRKVEDCGAAEEISQNVFSALSRKAWQFAPDDSLPAWLHKTALLESKFWLRGELRRRRREETAADLGTTMNTPEDHSAFHALVPLLDDALLSLREKDRTALLLRYYERQSLRDVGAAFGVNEKTAQKRVRSALEKLADFFKRRGFKTATVAATAAALQHTATSASATVVSTIVGASLRVSPPALVGFTALVARLASLSRVRTAAVCVVLAVVPVVWQLNQRHAAAAEVERNRAQLVAAQNDRAKVQGEIDRLRQVSERLQQSVAQANEAVARAAESAQAFEAWKRRIRGLLSAADYRWDDDSPFARIPKADLPELSELNRVEPFTRLGVVLPYARELLGMTPAERQVLEDTLRRHLADLEGQLAAGMYETNDPDPVNAWPDGQVLAGKVFGFTDMPDEDMKTRGDQLLSELRGLIGEERWPIIQTRLHKLQEGPDPPFSLLSRLHLDPGHTAQEIRLVVGTDGNGTLTWHDHWNSGDLHGYVNGPLTAFLPKGDPNRTDGADNFGGVVTEALRQRAATWLQEQATVRLGKKENP
jgi:RNA polymerase sigma factor (sigma-70 family)